MIINVLGERHSFDNSIQDIFDNQGGAISFYFYQQ